MPEQPQTFEQKLARIEQIVKDLERSGVDLADATKLFKEGKTLIAQCEADLKSAEAQIKAADRESQEATLQPSSELEDEASF